jgi:hypothetical protein
MEYFIFLLCCVIGIAIFLVGKSFLTAAAPSDIRTSAKYRPRFYATSKDARI